MAGTKQERRLDALTKWAALAAWKGHGVPTAQELADIAAHPDGWRDRLDSQALRGWAHVIDHTLHQVEFGVTADEIVRQLSDELDEPSEPVPPDANGGNSQGDQRSEATTDSGPAPGHPQGLPGPDEAQSPVVAALLAWREKRIAEGVDWAPSIKEVTLRNLVKWGDTDAETIGKKLPGPAAYLGAEIAEIIARFGQSTEGTAGSSESQAAAPPRPAPEPTPRLEAEPKSVGTRSSKDRIKEPMPVAPQRSRRENELLNLTHDDFCEYRYRRGDSDPEEPVVVTPGQIRVTPVDGGVRLSFDAYVPDTGKMVIYRVVSGDGGAPRKPEAGELVAATTSLRVDDRRDLRSAVRIYQVWCHVGIDQEDATRTNPFLLARGQEVSPVSEFAIHVEHGRITGEWAVFPGAERVRVYRIPMDGTARMDDPQHEICRGESNIDGFTDLEADPGVRYLYRVCAEVASQLSNPMEEEVTVPATLTPVEDLTISPSEHDSSRVDLTWTAPELGRVRVYWANARPRADVGQQQDLTESRLSNVDGFGEDNRIKGPTGTLDGGKARISAVAWPSDWPRIYLTPVTVLGDQVRVGSTHVETRPLPPVSNPEILERFDTEMVTFGWPAEAATVLAFVGSTTMTREEIVERNQPVDQITLSRYQRDGGITFERRLEAKGCTVVLVPVNFVRGEAVHGQLTALHYPGLHRLRYHLVPQRDNPTRYLNELYLSNDLDIDSAIALTMVNHPERLPLSPGDGDPVYFVPRDGGEATPQCLIPELKKGDWPTGWRADWTRQRGFFRLFITSQADKTKRYALADPPVSELFFRHDVAVPQAGEPE